MGLAHAECEKCRPMDLLTLTSAANGAMRLFGVASPEVGLPGPFDFVDRSLRQLS